MVIWFVYIVEYCVATLQLQDMLGIDYWNPVWSVVSSYEGLISSASPRLEGPSFIHTIQDVDLDVSKKMASVNR